MIKHLISMLCLIALSMTTAQAKTFKIATVAPDGTRWMTELKSGADEIEKRSDGRVKFRFYPGGVMGNDKSVLRKIKIGQLQGGAITGGGLQDISPDSQVYSLPLAFRSYDEVDYVRKKMDSLIIDNLHKNGFVSFGLGEGGFAYLMSNQTLDDIANLKNQKVWVPDDDAVSRAAFESIGVSPIPLPLTDVMTGLQTGMIDTVAASAMGAIALQWHSKVKYLNQTPLAYLYGTLIIDRGEFEKLSPADQQVTREVMAAVFKKLDSINREDNDKAFAALKQQGLQFVETSQASQKQWTSAVEKATQNLINSGAVGKELTPLLYKHLDEFRKGAK